MTVDLSTDYVTFSRDGEPCGGLLVRPETDRPAPAVVLMPAIAGINDYISGVARHLAEVGLVCCALDYYAREGGPPDLSSREKIFQAVAALPDSRVRADVGATVGYLREQSFVEPESVAVLGFCIGGTFALFSAVDQPDLSCAVCFYGQLRYSERTETKPVSALEVVDDASVPVLAHYGDADHIVPLDDVGELQIRLAGKPSEVYVYPGAGHAFHEDFRPAVYRPVAAAEAWRRSLHYLHWYLQGQVPVAR